MRYALALIITLGFGCHPMLSEPPRPLPEQLDKGDETQTQAKAVEAAAAPAPEAAHPAHTQDHLVSLSRFIGSYAFRKCPESGPCSTFRVDVQPSEDGRLAGEIEASPDQLPGYTARVSGSLHADFANILLLKFEGFLPAHEDTKRFLAPQTKIAMLARRSDGSVCLISGKHSVLCPGKGSESEEFQSLDAALRTDLVVYDPTLPEAALNGAKVSKEEGGQLLGRIFPKYLGDAASCPSVELSLDQARARGAFAPQAMEAADGSFTSRGLQRLYRISMGECGASGADNYGTGLLVVVENTKIVARAEIAGNEYLGRVLDLDEDGRHELLLLSGVTQGVEVTFARMVRFDGEQLAVLKDFGQMGESNCAFEEEDTYDNYSVIHGRVAAGVTPQFVVEKKEGRCR